MRRGLLVILLVLAASPLAAQYWVNPAKTPKTDTVCTNCPCNSPTSCSKDKLTVGYPPTLGTFVGRYLDSQHTNDFQQPFRTARARNVLPMPSAGRVYFIIGSALFAYDIDRFFQRVGSNEQLMFATGFPATGWAPWSRVGTVEKFLTFDQFFYAENTPSGWEVSGNDGQERLYSIDADDRGNVYLAYSYHGWGIVHDDKRADSSEMPSLFQYPTSAQHGDDVFPANIAVIKSATSGTYYALIGDATTNVTNVFDATNPSSTQRLTSVRRGLGHWAKTADMTQIGLVTLDGRFEVYRSDDFVGGRGPVTSAAGPGGTVFSAIASDGTNFYLTADVSTGLVIQTYAPDASGPGYHKVSELQTPRPTYWTYNLRYGDGYLVHASATDGSTELRLFKGNVNGLSEVDVQVARGQYFFKNYYYRTGIDGYTAPGTFGQFWDSGTVKRNGHTYLIVTAYGLGDVYDLQDVSSLALSSLGSLGTANPNRAGTAAGPFYGDPIGFTAATGAPQANIQWNFGNPEADTTGADPNLVNSVTGVQVRHRYSGITALAQLPLTRTVTATGLTDVSLYSTMSVTMAAPAVSLGIAGRAGVVSAPAQLASVPIVAGDRFIDSSDGSVESHFDTWSIDGAVTKALPSESIGAGPCGTSHTLNFDAHYGPYSGTSPNLTSFSDLPIGIHGAAYSVRPFVAAVTTAPSADSIVFTSASRLTADASVLSAAQAAALQYKWELLDASNQLLLAGPAGSGTIPSFTVPKSSFTSRGIRAHLVLTSPSPVGGGCAGLGMETAEAFTAALNGPDPVLNGDCTAGGPPCSFNASSLSGVDPTADNWTFAWSVQPNNILNATLTGRTFTPVFTQVGQYTISVTVANAIGSTTVHKSINVSTAGALCQQMLPGQNVFIYFIAPSGCSFGGGRCNLNESITFDAAGFNYDFSCAPHQFSWNFGDGSTATGKTVTHAYSSSGTYTVKLTITNPAQSVATTVSVPVTGVGLDCPPMLPNSNVSLQFQGASGCGPGSVVDCAANEAISFSAGNTYPFNCASHSFQWSFGDGQTATTATPATQHAYAAAGTYTASLTITNPFQTVSLSVPVHVAAGGCGKILPNQNVFVRYAGPTSGCAETNVTDCRNDEDILFDVRADGYDLTCGPPTFAWDFGDNSAPGSGKTPAHRYAGAGLYNVSVTVTVNNVTAKISWSVKVIDVHPTADCVFDFTVDPLSASEFVFTASGKNGATAASYNWDFGDGVTASGPAAQVTHTYTEPRAYTVTLTVPGTNCVVQHTAVKPRRRAAGR